MFRSAIVILWLVAGIMTMAIMTKKDSFALKLQYVITWAVLMVNLIADCFEA